MLRLHHSGLLDSHSEIHLSPEASHHLVHVMRVKTGQKFKLFNSTGEYLACLIAFDKKIAIAKLTEKTTVQTESPCQIILLQAVTRRERMDFSIQKATELGVSVIQPILTQHCVVKLDKQKSQKRVHHWQGIAQHASEQSGRLSIPEIKPVLNWNEALESIAQTDQLNLIFALAASKPLHQIESNAKNIALAIGPVGGFSQQELATAKNKHFQAIKLGPRILRSETATTAALTALQMRWGDLD